MTALAAPDARTPTAPRRGRRRDRRARLQRGGRPRAERAPAARLPARASSRSTRVDHHRRQREHRRAPGPSRRALAAELDGVRAVHLDAKGRGRALQQVWAASAGARRRLHGRRPVDRPRRAAAAGRAAAVRAQRRRDRQRGWPASSRVVRGPKREFISRCYNLLLRTTLRTRFSDAQCGFKAMRTDARARAAAARQGHGVVLRHRTAGARRAQRPAHRRGARSTGSTTRTAASTSSPPRWPTCAASPGVGRALAARRPAAARAAPAVGRDDRAAGARRAAPAGRPGAALRRASAC